MTGERIWHWRRLLSGDVPRLRYWVQILLLLALCVLVFRFTPSGDFLRELPLPQFGYMVGLLERHTTMEDRTRARIGPEYEFIRFVRGHTPEDAVILMSDQFAPSGLDPLRSKHQGWATYFLYPRKILYLHQQDSPWFEQAQWLIVDDPAAVSWIAPSWAVPFVPSQLGCVPFDMGAYMKEIRAGRISDLYLPPGRPARAPKQEWPESPEILESPE